MQILNYNSPMNSSKGDRLNAKSPEVNQPIMDEVIEKE